MSQSKINPATGYVHDDSQLEEKPTIVEVIEPVSDPEEKQEASE
jgi:hypothetical protein